MSADQFKIEVKRGDYNAGFESLHTGNDREEALRIAAKARKHKTQFVLVTEGANVISCRY